MSLPLDGVRVVEVASNLAGPFAAEILAHLGADVVKVERPEGGDDARAWGPPFWRGAAAGYLAMNLNKRGITVDLRDAEAVAWLRDLIGRADVLVQNLRPGVLEEIGLGAADLRARYPRLIYCSVRAFGAVGPLRFHPGYEPMVQAFSGLMAMNGGEDDPPTRMGTSVLDFGTGMWAAVGILAALEQRHRTGQGSVVDASLFETALTWLTGHYAFYRLSGEVPERHRTGSNRVVPFEGFETATGPLVVAAGNDRLFARFAQVLGRPEWAEDPRYATNADRIAHKPELIGAIQAIMQTQSKGHWLDRLEAAGVPCAPIHTMPEAVSHPQAAAVGMIQPVPGTDLELMSLPLSFDGRRPPIRRAPPALGEHDQEVRNP
jgi:crotonobetainyl-CoA:carnitine CoA-transferase CaiB-like acyl-CoA transferase